MLKKVVKRIVALKNCASALPKRNMSSVDARRILNEYYSDPDTSCWIESCNHAGGGGII